MPPWASSRATLYGILLVALSQAINMQTRALKTLQGFFDLEEPLDAMTSENQEQTAPRMKLFSTHPYKCPQPRKIAR